MRELMLVSRLSTLHVLFKLQHKCHQSSIASSAYMHQPVHLPQKLIPFPTVINRVIESKLHILGAQPAEGLQDPLVVSAHDDAAVAQAPRRRAQYNLERLELRAGRQAVRQLVDGRAVVGQAADGADVDQVAGKLRQRGRGRARAQEVEAGEERGVA